LPCLAACKTEAANKGAEKSLEDWEMPHWHQL
jgi:hypothetical protein